MKRIVSMLLIAGLAISFSACKKGEVEKIEKPTELGIGAQYKVDDYVEFTPIKITTTKKVTPTMGTGYFENNNNDEVYVDVVFDVINIGNDVIESEDFMEAIAENGSGTKYKDARYLVEVSNMTNIKSHEEMIPQTLSRFHASISVPETERELTLKFEIKDEEFEIKYNTEEELKKTIPLKVGDVLGDENYATAEFLGCEFADKVVPTDTSSYYNYYEVENSDNTYLALKFNVTNYQTDKKYIETFILAKAVFKEKYNYTGIVVGEETKTRLSSFAGIAPLSSMTVYCLIEVPKTVMEEEYEVSVMFNKNEYLYKSK